MKKKILALLAGMMLFTGSICGATGETIQGDKAVTVRNNQVIETKLVKDDQATKCEELKAVSDDLNISQKHYQKALMSTGLAAATVGTLYVGSHNWHDLQDKVGVDRAAHFAVSYIINDQLQKNAKMSPFAATLTTIAIGAAKEKFVDNKWDQGDFTADCLGAMVVNVKL